MAIGAQGKVLDAKKSNRGRIVCDACQRPTKDRICPVCHVTLPSTFGQCPNAIIAVIGAKNAGKSHYIATLVEEIRNRVGPMMNVTLSPQDDLTIQRFARDFRDPLYNERRALNVTSSGIKDDKVRLPMVFNLQFGGKDLFGRRRISRTITLVFFDTAGEDLNSEATMATVNRYIYRSSGIILLLDPRQFQYVRGLMSSPPDPGEVMTDTRDILVRTQKLIRNGRGLGPNHMIKTPLAVAFSKFDELEPIVDRSLAVLTSSSPSRRYDIAESTAISDEIESLLAAWQQAGLVHELRTWFLKVAFFGVSSLGCKKNPDQTLPRLDPRRVEDPFLWLLYQFGYIKGAAK
jgi:GTPase SAR1 family protein